MQRHTLPQTCRRPLMSLATLCLVLLSVSGLPTSQVAAKTHRGSSQKDAAGKEADLKQIRTRIESIRQTIQTDSSRRDALVGELQAADVSVQSAREQGAEIRRQRQASEHKLADLKREQATTEKQIAEERTALASDLRMAYMNGSEEQLKLLLNQQNPAELGRMLTYYGYFSRARAERIATISKQLNQLQSLADTIQAEAQHLREIEEQQQSQVNQLAAARQRRAHTLTTIQSKLRSHGDELNSLQREAATLEHLLEELRRAADDFPITSHQPFDNLQGKLPWPVKGKVTAHFGELRAGGPLKWEGILIEATPGVPVRAPLQGRVVYSDWLSGLGYLVVLDHGGGYLSLYGHNEQLYRKVGDMVVPGDVLGDLADRGGGKAALYLEIRRAKRPLDPQKWLRKP